MDRPKFIADENVGKLARVLRLLGFDASFFAGGNDSRMVEIAKIEDRTILTRDTHILKRKRLTSGEVKAILISTDNVDCQIKQVIETLKVQDMIRPFTLCLECNRPLEGRAKEQVQNRVPPYVWKTQQEYAECPKCNRIYWKGTHWEAMMERLDALSKETREN